MSAFDQRAPSAQRRPFHWLAPLAWCVVSLAAVQVLIGLLWHDDLSKAGAALLVLHYLAFMAQTFMFHAAVACAAVVVLALVQGRRRLLACAAMVFCVGALPEIHGVLPRDRYPADRPTLTVMSVNLMYGRINSALLLREIERVRPDVLLFQEWTPAAGAAITDNIKVRFPHSLAQVRDDAFGAAVFSQQPFHGEPRVFPPISGFSEPQITIGVLLDGEPVTITSVHLLPPVSLEYFRQQRSSAARYAAWISDPLRTDRPDVLMGDFNAVPRSSLMRSLRAAGVRDAHAEAGQWRGRTWPEAGMLAYLPGIRLDHALIGPRLECVRCEVGAAFGSDHRPITATFAIRNPPAKPLASPATR